MVPTSAGLTALIGDPGPTYTHSVDLTAFVPAPESFEWPFPETSRARIARYARAFGKLAELIVAVQGRLGEQARITALGLQRLAEILAASTERQEAV